MRGRAEAARRAHNPEVGGSNPLPATHEKRMTQGHPFSFCIRYTFRFYCSGSRQFVQASTDNAVDGDGAVVNEHMDFAAARAGAVNHQLIAVKSGFYDVGDIHFGRDVEPTTKVVIDIETSYKFATENCPRWAKV